MNTRSVLLICLFFILFLFGTDVFLLDKFRSSLQGLFSGLLALTGFIFTARTFITFKLNEVVYGNPEYQKYVENLKKEGAYQKELYDPLRKLDNNLGTITFMCLAGLFLTLLLVFFPEVSKIKFPQDFEPTYISDFAFTKEGWLKLWNYHLVIGVLVQKIYSSFVASYLLLTILKLLQSVKSMNRNIGAIIDHWEVTYKNNNKAKP